MDIVTGLGRKGSVTPLQYLKASSEADLDTRKGEPSKTPEQRRKGSRRRRIVRIKAKNKKVKIGDKKFKIDPNATFAVLYKDIVKEIKALKKNKPIKSNNRYRQLTTKAINQIKKLDPNTDTKLINEFNQELIDNIIRTNPEISIADLNDLLKKTENPKLFHVELNNYLNSYRTKQNATRIDELEKLKEELKVSEKHAKDIEAEAAKEKDRLLELNYMISAIGDKRVEERDKLRADKEDSEKRIKELEDEATKERASYAKELESLEKRAKELEEGREEVEDRRRLIKESADELYMLTEAVKKRLEAVKKGTDELEEGRAEELEELEAVKMGIAEGIDIPELETIKINDDITLEGEGRGQREDELDEYAKDIPGYLGAVTYDEIQNYTNDLLDDQFNLNSLIVNTLPRAAAGKISGHWCALVVENDYDLGRFTICWFDPLGDTCPEHIHSILTKLVESSPFEYEFKNNLVNTQDGDSSLCGFHCLHLLKQMTRGIPWIEATHFKERESPFKPRET